MPHCHAMKCQIKLDWKGRDRSSKCFHRSDIAMKFLQTFSHHRNSCVKGSEWPTYLDQLILMVGTYWFQLISWWLLMLYTFHRDVLLQRLHTFGVRDMLMILSCIFPSSPLAKSMNHMHWTLSECTGDIKVGLQNIFWNSMAMKQNCLWSQTKDRMNKASSNMSLIWILSRHPITCGISGPSLTVPWILKYLSIWNANQLSETCGILTGFGNPLSQ